MVYNDIMTRDYLSYSSISTFSKCPEQFRRTRIEEIGGAFNTQENARGKLIHKWTERLTRIRLNEGYYPNEHWAGELLEELWHDGYQEDDGYNPLTDTEWDNDFLVLSYEGTMRLVPRVVKLLDTLIPTGVEQFRQMDLPKPGKDIKRLLGHIDLIAEPNLIFDWKVRSSPANDKWLDVDLQATVYTALAGFEKATVNFVQIVIPKRQPSRLVVSSTTRDSRHVNWLLNQHIPAILRVIDSDTYHANPSWACHFCPTPCGAAPDLEASFGIEDDATTV